MPTLCHRVLEVWRRAPERPWLHFIADAGCRTFSYDDLVRRAAWFAGLYRTRGLVPGDVVLLVLDHSADAGPAFLGAMMLGAVPSFLPPLTVKQDPVLYWHSMKVLVARIEARLIVTFPAYREMAVPIIPDLADRMVVAPEAAAEGRAAAVPEPLSGDPAFLQHSSGTTGLKKGVALSHRAVLAQIDRYRAVLGLSNADVIASWLPLYHDMGLIACLVMPMVTGVPVVAMDALDWTARPVLLFEAIERHRATLVWLPNFAFHHLAAAVPESARLDLSSLRAIINCSEPCKPATFDLFARRFAACGVRPEMLQCCYAMAENVFAVTQTPLGRPVPVDRVDRALLESAGIARPAAAGADGARALLGCGPPLDGVDVRIVDDGGRTLAERQVGEIAVTGPCRFDGYFRLPEESARTLQDGWYRTGDLGYLAGGGLYVTGRKDDLLIINGRNLYAHDIESLVNQVDGVTPGRCVALGAYNDQTGSQDLVVVAEGERDPAVARAIRNRVLAETGFRVTVVRLVDAGWLIKTSSGKISRVENLNKYRESVS